MTATAAPQATSDPTPSSTPQPTPSARRRRERVRIPSPRSTHHSPLDLVPIPQETIARALARLDAIFSDPNASHRDTNAAARTLLAFLKHNHNTLRALMAAQDQEHEATPPPSADDDPLDPDDPRAGRAHPPQRRGHRGTDRPRARADPLSARLRPPPG